MVLMKAPPGRRVTINDRSYGGAPDDIYSVHVDDAAELESVMGWKRCSGSTRSRGTPPRPQAREFGGIEYIGGATLRKVAGPRVAAKPALQQSTRLALARAGDAVAKSDAAKRMGNPSEIARARGEALVAKADLERANANEKALSAMRGALAKPVRIF